MDERAAAILELLFRAPGDPRAWRAFLEALGRAISPDVRVLTLVEVTRPAPSTTLSGVDLQEVAPGVLPRRTDKGPRIEALAPGSLFELPRLGARLASNPVLRKLLGPHGLRAGPGLGVMLGRDGSRTQAILLVLPCRKDWAPSTRDRELLGSLAPFLPLAARLHERLAGASALTSLLDHLVLGVILLDDHSRVSYANRSAAEVLGVEPGLSEPAPGDERTEALFRTVRSEGSDDRSIHRHPSDGRPLQVLASPLEWQRDHGFSARHFHTALFIGDPKHRTGDPFESLGRMYGLTPAESRLAWLLVGDLTLAEAAAQLGITQSTSRTVLKRVLAKTGTRRQASLVRLLLSGPAQLRTDSGAADTSAPRRGPKRRRQRAAKRTRHIP